MHPLSSLNVGSYVISGLDRVETEHENDTAYDRDVHADFRVSGIKRLKRLFRVGYGQLHRPEVGQQTTFAGNGWRTFKRR